MKGHRRAEPPGMKRDRGTYRPDRDGNRMEVEVLPPGSVEGATAFASPHGLPQQPEWLTDAGKDVWLDDVGRVSSTRLATETDSTMFATYCNIQGAIIAAWRAGDVPPASHLAEARRMAEQFGIFGRKSRVVTGGGGEDRPSNPFTNNGRRS